MFKNPKVLEKTADKHECKENKEKRSRKMTDGIGRIFGGNSYGVGGFYSQKKNEESAEAQQNPAPQQQNTEAQLDPQRVMDFLAQNNYFMPVAEETQVTGAGEVSEETRGRIADYMKDFEFIYSVIEKEFGATQAPVVMDIAMDVLIGMAA